MNLFTDEAPECLKCHYDLTGLLTKGRCPECGLRYNLSTGAGTQLDVSRFMHMDRKLQTMRIWALLLAGLGLFALCIAIELARQTWGSTTRSPASSPILWTGGLVSLILILAAAADYAYRNKD